MVLHTFAETKVCRLSCVAAGENPLSCTVVTRPEVAAETALDISQCAPQEEIDALDFQNAKDEVEEPPAIYSIR